MEDFAALEVEAIRKVQPSGPYSLGGFSASAVAAFEAARQLRAQGEKVALLVLFDGENTAAPKVHTRVGRINNRLSSIVGKIRYHAPKLIAGAFKTSCPICVTA
jgi:thioesterase domain-containing protein